MNIVGKHVHDVKYFQERKKQKCYCLFVSNGVCLYKCIIYFVVSSCACNVIVIRDLGFVFFCIFLYLYSALIQNQDPICNFTIITDWPERDVSSNMFIFLVARSPGGDISTRSDSETLGG